jgi:DNA-binding CsgD family transcriptional regulator
VAVREAAEVAERLGARPLRERADDLATRLGIRAVPAAVVDGARGRGRYDLTARELEVLQLMVGGRSDGEIASKLFISKKTVSVHVNNIKGKLGAESRVHIVTTALARGLVPQAR